MKTDQRILEIAEEILSYEGLGALSFDAIARRLGRSKQAVLYWFPTKPDLLAALFLPLLEAEADIAARAVGSATNRAGAISSFVTAVAEFHLANLERFRLMYLAPQTTQHRGHSPEPSTLLQRIPPVTSRIYDALAPHLDKEETAARQQAVAVHAAVLGLVLMVSLSDAVNDPLRHGTDALINALIASLTQAP